MVDDDRQAALNAIDLKGNIVLKEFGDTALLFRPQNNYEPFVVAYGYNKAAGEWSHGSYHTDLGHAFEEANPEIIEDACVRWQRGDIATALGNEEYPATDANVSWILNRSTMGDFHEEMTAKGNERLGEIVHEQERYLDKASGKNLAASEGRDAYLRLIARCGFEGHLAWRGSYLTGHTFNRKGGMPCQGKTIGWQSGQRSCAMQPVPRKHPAIRSDRMMEWMSILIRLLWRHVATGSATKWLKTSARRSWRILRMIARSTRSGRMKAKESHVKCAFPCKFPVLSVVVGEQVLACLDVHHHAQELCMLHKHVQHY